MPPANALKLHAQTLNNMAATNTIFNPLIKKGFQELNDVSSIQAAIDALQENVNTLQHALNALKSNKITKVTQAAELSEIEVNEIFEWQADNATIDGVSFVKGYFYQASSATGSVTPPVDMLQFSNAFPLNAEYVLGDYNFTFGNYYKIQAYANNVSTITIYDYTDTNSVYRYHCLAPINVNDAVGKIVFDRQLNTFETITEVDAVNYIATTDNGQYINISGVSYGGFTALWQCGNADGTEKFNILIPSSGMYYLLVHYDFANNVIIDWFPFQCIKTTSGSSYTYNTVGFAQTDTQPQQLSVVDNQVLYTLSDGTTQISLMKENSISDAKINFENTSRYVTKLTPGSSLSDLFANLQAWFYGFSSFRSNFKSNGSALKLHIWGLADSNATALFAITSATSTDVGGVGLLIIRKIELTQNYAGAFYNIGGDCCLTLVDVQYVGYHDVVANFTCSPTSSTRYMASSLCGVAISQFG